MNILYFFLRKKITPMGDFTFYNYVPSSVFVSGE